MKQSPQWRLNHVIAMFYVVCIGDFFVTVICGDGRRGHGESLLPWDGLDDDLLRYFAKMGVLIKVSGVPLKSPKRAVFFLPNSAFCIHDFNRSEKDLIRCCCDTNLGMVRTIKTPCLCAVFATSAGIELELLHGRCRIRLASATIEVSP